MTGSTTLLPLALLLLLLLGAEAAMVGRCQAGASASYQRLPDDADCSVFWWCDDAGGPAALNSCPAGLWFNPARGVCDFPANVRGAPCPLG